MLLGMSIHSRAQSEELGAVFCVLRMRVNLGREAQQLRERDKIGCWVPKRTRPIILRLCTSRRVHFNLLKMPSQFLCSRAFIGLRGSQQSRG